MRILNAESTGYSPIARSVLAGLGQVIDADVSRRDLLSLVGDADVLIVRLRNTIDEEVLACAPRLNTIVSATTGLDHIDLNAAERHGVTVLSLRGEAAFLRTITATAEHTWALLLGLIRRLVDASDVVRTATERSDWDRDQFRGTELRDKRLGLVGLGRIGAMVANYGQAFGMRVAAVDPHLAAWPDGITRYDDLAQLAAQSDILSIHVPLDETTFGLIGQAVIGALPDGAIVVNTSRGDVVDENALCRALEAGALAGVAADVVVGERSPGRGRLADLAQRHPRVLITPHIGGATKESMERTEIFMAEKLATHLAVAVQR